MVMNKVLLIILGITTFALAGAANAEDTDKTVRLTVASSVSDKTYEVNVEGKRRDDLDDVMNKALYKAAKKTLKSDYEWFRVILNETEKSSEKESRVGSRFAGGFETVPERRCGLLGCSNSTRTTYRGGIRSDFPERKTTRYSVTLEYKMGSGPVADNNNVYDAKIVKTSYKK